MHGLRVCLSIAVTILATALLAKSLAAPAVAQSLASSQTVERMLVNAPPGFHDACRRYGWLCEHRAVDAQPVDAAQLLDLARSINRRVNFLLALGLRPDSQGGSEVTACCEYRDQDHIGRHSRGREASVRRHW